MKKSVLITVMLLISFFAAQAQFREGFDATTFPPTGWVNVHTTGDDPAAVWERATANALGGELVEQVSYFVVNPHTGAGMATFDSYNHNPGNAANLITSVVNLSTGGENVVSFWMYRDNTFDTADSISVYINTTQSATGAIFLGTIRRKRSLSPVEAGPNGWYQYEFAIPASFNTATNYLVFSAVSQYGNSMFIDDVYAGPKLTCGPVTALATSNYNYAAASVTASWTAPVLGAPSGYEYAVNTTGVSPASGTATSGTTLNLTGLTTGAVNYIYVRTSCGGNLSSWSSTALAVLPCATGIVPATGSTNVPNNQVFSWPAVTGATAYDFYLGTSAGMEVYLGQLDETSVVFNTLLPLATYYWYIVPVIDGVPAPANCVSNSFTMAAEAATPTNNTCSGAVTITAGNIAGNPVTSTTLNASISRAAEACEGFAGSADDDVWFQFTTNSVPPTGILTIAPVAADGIIDIVAQVYASNDCNNLGTPVACLDTSVDNVREQLNLSKLAPNTHYFMRVYSFFNDPDDRGGFTIELSAGASLPVQLSSFTARRAGNVNILNWTSEQEINTKHFSIERSTDGVSFTAIGQVSAAGNSSTARTYVYTDQHPAKGNNYYRLRTFDLDNSSKLSDTRLLRNDGAAEISMYPNPAGDKINLEIYSDKLKKGNLAILDVSGKLVYSRMINLPVGNTVLPIQLSNISAGSYILKVQLDQDVVTRRFNKQ